MGQIGVMGYHRCFGGLRTLLGGPGRVCAARGKGCGNGQCQWGWAKQVFHFKLHVDEVFLQIRNISVQIMGLETLHSKGFLI